MDKREIESFVVFRNYATSDEYMSIQGLRNMAQDMQLDFDLLRALVDDDGNARISLEEFTQFWSDPNKFSNFRSDRLDLLREWLAYFESLDLNKDGVLSVQEIEAFSKQAQHDVDVSTLLAALDTDRSGTIGFEEFLKWYKIA